MSNFTKSMFPSPHPGIINFFFYKKVVAPADQVSVPSSGDYQFLHQYPLPLHQRGEVSVPSSGDYQFLPYSGLFKHITDEVSVPSSGDYQFLPDCVLQYWQENCFRPLIRGLSISSAWRRPRLLQNRVSVPSSGDYQFLLANILPPLLLHQVSVPSSGDYQFLPLCRPFSLSNSRFPSPHPGIINFFLSAIELYGMG